MIPLARTTLLFGSFWALMSLLHADLGQLGVGLMIAFAGAATLGWVTPAPDQKP